MNADKLIRTAAGATVAELAAIAGAISYSHMRQLAQDHGQVGWHGHAFLLSVDGMRQADVAAELGVSAQTALRWHCAWLEQGQAGLASAGRRRRLDDGQLAQVEAALARGPKANGFGTEMWTLAPVAEVIEQVAGVRYSQAQTWVVLRERLGWTRQRPARRAVERNEEDMCCMSSTEPGPPARFRSSSNAANPQYVWPGHAARRRRSEPAWYPLIGGATDRSAYVREQAVVSTTARPHGVISATNNSPNWLQRT